MRNHPAIMYVEDDPQSRIIMDRKDGYVTGTRGYLRDVHPRVWGTTRRHINPDALRIS